MGPPSSVSSRAASASIRCSEASSAAGESSSSSASPKRALREGREPADRLDLVAEELEAGSTVLRGAEDVQDAPAERELPARLDLIDALVPRFGQELGAEGEVDLLSHPQREALGAKRRVGHRLGQGDRAGDHHWRLAGSAAVSASRAAMRRPTRCGGGATCEAYPVPRDG